MEAVKEGHELYSPAFHRAVKSNFDRMIAPLPKTSPAPEYFEPLPEASTRSIVSAPVSRDYVPTSNRGERPGIVRLSAEERDMARRLNMSEKDYALGKLENEQRKRDGYYDR